MGTIQDISNRKSLIVKEEGGTKVDDKGVQRDIRYRWVVGVFSIVSPQEVKISLDRINVLCLRWRKKKVIHRMFSYI